MEVKRGAILAITKGEYSDYCLIGHVKALSDFSDHDTKARFVSQLPKEDAWQSFDIISMYMAWLIREGLVEPCEDVSEYYVEFPYDMLEEWLDGI